jgi:hypothetical protein
MPTPAGGGGKHELRRNSHGEVGCPTHRQLSAMVSAQLTC